MHVCIPYDAKFDLTALFMITSHNLICLPRHDINTGPSAAMNQDSTNTYTFHNLIIVEI